VTSITWSLVACGVVLRCASARVGPQVLQRSKLGERSSATAAEGTGARRGSGGANPDDPGGTHCSATTGTTALLEGVTAARVNMELTM
jgi:hypothetical protein